MHPLFFVIKYIGNVKFLFLKVVKIEKKITNLITTKDNQITYSINEKWIKGREEMNSQRHYDNSNFKKVNVISTSPPYILHL